MSSGRAGAGASRNRTRSRSTWFHFPEDDEGEVSELCAPGLDLARRVFGSAMTEERTGGVSSHQPSLSSRRGSRDRRNRNGDDLRHGPRPCPADWQRVCPACSGFAYFRADFAQTDEEAGNAERRPRANRPFLDGFAVPMLRTPDHLILKAVAAATAATKSNDLGEKRMSHSATILTCRARRRQERTRDLHHPRDLVAADSVPGAGLFLFLPGPRQSRLRRADHERGTEILADWFLPGAPAYSSSAISSSRCRAIWRWKNSAPAAGSRASW